MVSSYRRGVAAIDEQVRAIVADPAMRAYRYWDERAQPVATKDPDIVTINYVVRGLRTLVGIGSWSDRRKKIWFAPRWRELGIKSSEAAVYNVETGGSVPVTRGYIRYELAPFDVALLEIRQRSRKPRGGAAAAPH
jgi:hypothetical protein